MKLNIIELKETIKISDKHSFYWNKFFKIKDDDIKEISDIEFYEYKDLWVEELWIYKLEDYKKVLDKLIKEKKKLKKNTEKQCKEYKKIQLKN